MKKLLSLLLLTFTLGLFVTTVNAATVTADSNSKRVATSAKQKKHKKHKKHSHKSSASHHASAGKAV